MALTAAETTRIQVIEGRINQIQDSINLLPTVAQLKGTLSIRQAEIDTLTTKLVSLESQIELLQKAFLGV